MVGGLNEGSARRPVSSWIERLTRPLDPADEDIREDLAGLVLGRLELVWFGATCLTGVCLTYAALADLWTGVALLLVGAAAVAFRVASLRGTKPGPGGVARLKPAIVSGLVYGGVVGLVGAACAVSGVAPVVLLGGLVTTGIGFGAAFTNAGAPLFARLQMVLICAPYIVAVGISDGLGMFVVALQGPLWIGGISMIISSMHDLSARLIRAQKQSYHLAFHDVLTGLANRARLMEALHAMRTSRPDHAYLLYLDVDGFKGVNDNLGHLAGDELLRLLARRIRSELRPDDLVSRIGGDEFVVVLRNLDLAGVERVASRLIDAARAPFTIGGSEASVGLSVGGAPIDVAGDPDRAIAAADAMLYAAKRAGKGQARFAA